MPLAYNNKCRDITLTELAARSPVIVVRLVIVTIVNRPLNDYSVTVIIA